MFGWAWNQIKYCSGSRAVKKTPSLAGLNFCGSIERSACYSSARGCSAVLLYFLSRNHAGWARRTRARRVFPPEKGSSQEEEGRGSAIAAGKSGWWRKLVIFLLCMPTSLPHACFATACQLCFNLLAVLHISWSLFSFAFSCLSVSHQVNFILYLLKAASCYFALLFG